MQRLCNFLPISIGRTSFWRFINDVGDDPADNFETNDCAFRNVNKLKNWDSSASSPMTWSGRVP